MKITIDSSLRSASPNLALGVIESDVQYQPLNIGLWELLQSRGVELASPLHGEDLGGIPAFAEARRTYRQLGKDPSRYRGSAEALFRRLLSGRGLYQVNNIVDVNNLISLESRHPVGVYDAANIAGPVSFRVGEPGEAYLGIGKASVNLEGLPVFSDERGPFGSPTSDSQRAMITPETSRVSLVVIAFSGPEGLDGILERACAWLKMYAGAARATSARCDK